MHVKHVQGDSEAFRDPDGAAWAAIPREVLDLVATPPNAQPNRHIKNSLAGKQWGACKSVQLQALHDGHRVYFRLEWTDATCNERHDEDLFPDAAALLFPMNGEAPLETMGSAEHPVNAWFWRPDIEAEPENIVAGGIGTVQRKAPDELESKSAREGAAWKVVFARPLTNGQAQSGVALKPGQRTSIAVAVWDGSAGERAGIKAFSRTWREIELES